jgi:hypothetical protein
LLDQSRWFAPSSLRPVNRIPSNLRSVLLKFDLRRVCFSLARALLRPRNALSSPRGSIARYDLLPISPGWTHNRVAERVSVDLHQAVFHSSRGNLRSWLPATSLSRVPTTLQTSAPSTYRRLGRGRDQAISADGSDARKMVKGLIAANDFLGFRFKELRAAVSKGYSRGRLLRARFGMLRLRVRQWIDRVR